MADFNTSNAMGASSFSICQKLGNLNDPEKASPISLAVSLSVLVVVGIFLGPLSIFLHTLILLAFYKKPALRTQTNIFFVAFTGNNLLRTTLAYPLVWVKGIAYQMGRQQNCQVIFILFNIISPLSVIFLTAAVNCERFISIKFPIWHRNHVTKPRLVYVAVVLTVAAQSISILQSFVIEILAFMNFVFAGCTVATFIFAVLIWRVILRRNQEVHTEQQSQSASATRSERKAAKIATYLALSFLCTRIIPLLILQKSFKEDPNQVVDPIIFGLNFLNFLLESSIYGLMNENIKKACLEILKWN